MEEMILLIKKRQTVFESSFVTVNLCNTRFYYTYILLLSNARSSESV
jgi:hypothetical protein